LKDNRIYIYGFGNPGRQDDGLGPAIIDRLEQDNIPGIITDSNYQLNVEDAYNISASDIVIFVDASIDAEEPFSFKRIEPSNEITFTTHSMSPESVLALSNEMYDKDIEAYVLAIRGYEWEFLQEFSSKAVNNFNEAYAFLTEKIKVLVRVS
jgi:hydrogenase maturation protease